MNLTRRSLLVAAVISVTTALPALGDDLIRRAPTLPKSTPWDLATLSKAPEVEWIDRESPVRSLLYRGLDYKGKPSRVFALYATPGTLEGDTSSDSELPAVVLVHGGGGTAFEEWVRLWASQGYAAIAMDLSGRGAGRKRLPDGGPEQSDDVKFGHIDKPVTDQWTYHAVANVVLAHSLVLSFDEVDRTKTALTGISWGGYLTCIVAGIDSRFRAAVPVYGCGFLHDGSVWGDRFAKMTPEQRTRWVKLWDPSRYVGSASIPMMFVNGTNDFAYWLESYAKTYDLVHSPRTFRITLRMPHGHRAGWIPSEILTYVNDQLLGATPLPRIARPRVEGGQVRAYVSATRPLRAATICWTSASNKSPKRPWKSAEAKIVGTSIVADPPPPDAKIWFLTVSDDRGSLTSSELVFAATRPTQAIRLLPAKSLDAFYTFLKRSGKDSDPKGVFTLEDGVLHVSGEDVGYLATRNDYADYRLVAEFRWGDKTWDGKNRGRDSGLFFHFTGPDRLFPRSLECQLKEGCSGDLCLIAGGAMSVGDKRRRRGTFERPGKHPWKDKLGYRGQNEIEKPHGEWNTIEIICRGDHVRLSLNGRKLHSGTGARPASGKIYLQSYSAELFFRRLELFPLAPSKD